MKITKLNLKKIFNKSNGSMMKLFDLIKVSKIMEIIRNLKTKFINWKT